MLVHITIRDLVLIARLQLGLDGGLTVITGETGAGKSVLAAALGLLTGDRASVELVRAGAEQAIVEGLFQVRAGSSAAQRLAEQGLDGDSDGQLVVRRVVARSGRHRAFVNGSPVTVGMLRELAGELVDISSQHEHQSLLRVDAGRLALDAFARLAPQLDAHRSIYADWRHTRDQLATLRSAAQERTSRADYLRYQVDEIEALSPESGEDERLGAERERLRNADALLQACARAVHGLYESDESVVGLLGNLAAGLERFAGIDEDLGPPLDRLAEARVACEDAAADLRDHLGFLEVEPGRLDEVEHRLHRLDLLLRKHGPTLDDLLARWEDMVRELARLGGAEERLDALTEELALRAEELRSSARRLSALRKTAAGRFAAEVEEHLRLLGMPNARFELELVPLEEPGEWGAEEVHMIFGPNPGEPPRPLRHIASGGELSRVLLAVKRVIADVDPVPTYLFDEVDTGVSGPVAEAIGRLLRSAAVGHQILCITHHPQVAAHADGHLLVSKTVEGGRTEASVRSLEAAERIDELSRMLGGAAITDATRLHAQELLEPGS